MSKIVKDISSNARVRHFDVVFYGSLEELLHIIHEYRARIQRYAFILHDKDEYDDDVIFVDTGKIIHRKGDIKVNHFHLVVSFYNACTLSACAKIFRTEKDNPRVFSVGDMLKCYEYLIHKNNPDKYQYNKRDIVSDDLNYFERLRIVGERNERDNIAEQIVMDLLAGVNTRIMVIRYGRDFIINMARYIDCADKIRSEDFYDKQRREELDAYRKAQLEEIKQPKQLGLDFDNK